MSIKPILFNTEMVRAILDGRKTCTRRVLKQPFEVHQNGYITKPRGDERPCPYIPPYQSGDVLYVRETWCKDSCWGEKEQYYYKADDSRFFHRWRPSIHMPKEAARIFLKVTDVRVERLQDITDDGAKAEGANWKNGKNVGWEEKMRRTAVERFAEIWESTIKKTDKHIHGWNANPYVWVVEFERCEKPRKE
jgi:hypothetical protein